LHSSFVLHWPRTRIHLSHSSLVSLFLWYLRGSLCHLFIYHHTIFHISFFFRTFPSLSSRKNGFVKVSWFSAGATFRSETQEKKRDQPSHRQYFTPEKAECRGKRQFALGKKNGLKSNQCNCYVSFCSTVVGFGRDE